MELTERIKSLAAEKGYTLASIERELSFGQGSIRKWSNAAPSADKLYKVAKLFEVSMEFLLTGGLQSSDKSEIEITGISPEAIRTALVWDSLDEAGKVITKGEIYRRAEAKSQEAKAERDNAMEQRPNGDGQLQNLA